MTRSPLSNSGDTAELCDIVAYAKRFRIPLIGITRRAHSSLAEQSDVALILPPSPRSLLGLAPTTSTTLMLALGDALAVALLERRGFRRRLQGVPSRRPAWPAASACHRDDAYGRRTPLAPLDIRCRKRSWS